MLEDKTIPEVLDITMECLKALDEIVSPARVNIELLSGDITGLRAKRQELINEIKNLEVEKAEFQGEINKRKRAAEVEIDALKIDAKRDASEAIRILDDAKKLFIAAETRKAGELREKALQHV